MGSAAQPLRPRPRRSHAAATAAPSCAALRIATGESKSKKRKALEAEAADRPGKQPFLGVDASKKMLWCPAWGTPVVKKDTLGRTVIAPIDLTGNY